MITEEDKERVRAATDFVALVSETVELKPRGRDFWGRCPFHTEKSASFKLNPQTGLWHCFGCGEGGDVFSYIQKRDHLDFPQAIRALADRSGIEINEDIRSAGPKKSRLLMVLEEAENYFHTMLMRGKAAGSDAARSYLASRGFGAEICRRWKLGYAPGHGKLCGRLLRAGFSAQEIIAADLGQERYGNLQDRFFDRVIFPIHDEQGRCIAFGGRILSADQKAAKYLNSRETAVFHKGSQLFAFDRAKAAITAAGEAIVCEGYTDVIAMHEAGFTNTVAALGTAFREEHIALIERQRAQRIICLFDGDEAGQRAAERSVAYVERSRAELLCVVLPGGQDPMEYLNAHRPEDMAKELAGARPLIDFVFEKRLENFDLSSPGKRVAALKATAGLLAPLKNSVLLDEYALKLAQKLGTDATKTKAVLVSSAQTAQRSTGDTVATGAAVSTGAQRPPAVPGAPTAPDSELLLSASARSQLAAERELTGAMLLDADHFREFAQRISTVSWIDERLKTIALAFLSAREGASVQDLLQLASGLIPEAPRLLSAGCRYQKDVKQAPSVREYLVSTLELTCAQRRLEELTARLSSDLDEDTERALYREASDLQLQIADLKKKTAFALSI